MNRKQQYERIQEVAKSMQEQFKKRQARKARLITYKFNEKQIERFIKDLGTLINESKERMKDSGYCEEEIEDFKDGIKLYERLLKELQEHSTITINSIHWIRLTEDLTYLEEYAKLNTRKEILAILGY